MARTSLGIVNTGRLWIVSASAVAGLSTPALAVNVLVDGGFESNPLTTISNSLNFFSTFQGQWGVESATNTGPSDGVGPLAGLQMHRMTNAGGVATQTTQVTDITSFAAAVDAGNASLLAAAQYNAGAGIPAAAAGISVSFHDATALFANQTGASIASSLVLDASPNTWETISTTTTIPTGTRWIVTQVLYNNASLSTTAGTSGAGMVDQAFTDIRVVPEPATLAAIAGAAGLLVARRRR